MLIKVELFSLIELLLIWYVEDRPIFAKYAPLFLGRKNTRDVLHVIHRLKVVRNTRGSVRQLLLRVHETCVLLLVYRVNAFVIQIEQARF